MNHLFEKIAYLRGLSEGLEIEKTTKEGKVINEIINALEEFADAIDNIAEEQVELAEYVESIDEGLTDLEEDLEDDMYPEGYEFDEDDDMEFVEVECPYCGEDIFVDEYLIDSEDTDVVCPECDNVVVVSEDCNCNCDHEDDEDDDDGCCEEEK
ncbi:MAG: CD1247 N-terminal domain-containing protein [Alkaliphilus sp.]